MFLALGYSQIEVHCLSTINTICYTLVLYIVRNLVALIEGGT